MSLTKARSLRWAFIGWMAGLIYLACATPPVEPPLPSRLPPGITDAASLRQRLAMYPAGPKHTRKRKADCTFCADIDVSIETRGITSEINPLNAPNDERPVALLFNEDHQRREAFYKLNPQDSAVLWVHRDPSSGRAQWTLLRILPHSNTVVPGPTAWLNYCHLYVGQVPGATDADFAKDHEKEHNEGKCNVPIPTIYVALKTASILQFTGIPVLADYVMALAATYARSDGAWIECANGCCT